MIIMIIMIIIIIIITIIIIIIILNYLIEYVSRKSFPYINNVRQVDPLKRLMLKEVFLIILSSSKLFNNYRPHLNIFFGAFL